MMDAGSETDGQRGLAYCSSLLAIKEARDGPLLDACERALRKIENPQAGP